jgi:hypothetical protein
MLKYKKIFLKNKKMKDIIISGSTAYDYIIKYK